MKNTIKFLFFMALSQIALNLSAQKINSESIKTMIENSKEQENSFTGFALYDISKKKMIAEYNSNKYFTPASNTKLFSFYAGLKILGDSLPALKYYVENDTLFFTGTGDPSFLNFDIKTGNRVYNFLKNSKETLCYLEGTYTSKAFGKGWAWDDYNDYYSAERSNFPIYGNIMRFKGKKDGTYSFLPKYFFYDIEKNDKVEKRSPKVIRDIYKNEFEYFTKPYRNFSQDIPFKTSTDLMLKLLSDTLKRKVAFDKMTSAKAEKMKNGKILRSISADKLYKQMLYVSDNFMAEQILLMCSFTLNGNLDTDFAIKYASENLLNDLPDELHWIDGSGLSRYNLFTPRDFVFLLKKIYAEKTQEQLFELLPAGGHSGTLKKWYDNGTGKPYIFAKTGTLSNNHNLSGFLVTKKGKVLIFSFMNNHFMGSTANIKDMMSRILLYIYKNY